MEIYYTIQRPSTLLTSACAPSAQLPILVAERAPLSQVHQVQTQAELARILVLGDSGMAALKGSAVVDGSTGFGGGNGVSVTDGASGVPPRGRPV